MTSDPKARKTLRPGRPAKGSEKYVRLRVRRVEKALEELPMPTRHALLASYCRECALRLSPAYPHLCLKGPK